MTLQKMREKSEKLFDQKQIIIINEKLVNFPFVFLIFRFTKSSKSLYCGVFRFGRFIIEFEFCYLVWDDFYLNWKRYRFRVLIPLFRNHPRTIWTYVKPLTDHAISANAVENLFKQFIILSNLMQIKLCWSQ